MGKNILFVSETIPGNSIASAVLLYRHLKWLEAKGNKISIFSYGDAYKNKSLPSTWDIIETQIRRIWYLPYRSSKLLRTIRFWMLYLEYGKRIKNRKIDILFSHLHGQYYSGFSSFLSRKMNLPLFVFYHDNTEKMNYTGNEIMYRNQVDFNYFVLRQAKSIWSVSEQLFYPEFKSKTKIVYPVSEETNLKSYWKKEFENGPVVGFAGSLYNEILPSTMSFVKVIEKLNGKFIIFSPVQKNVEKLRGSSSCVIVNDVQPTDYVCNYIVSHCSSFLVNYPETVAEMPWTDSNFPSKFTQFIQTHIPIICQVPGDSAIGIWCEKNKFLGYTSRFDENATEQMLKKTMTETDWKAMAEQSKYFAKTAFNSEKINKIIEDDIFKHH